MFSPDLFRFLTELSQNNERAWFAENKPRYEASIKEPALDFIEAFRPKLAEITPHVEANARVQGGSLFRIHRDTRFANDKTPYKTHTGIHFRHERAKDAHAPGFYLHLEPRKSFIGVGMWRPEPRMATQIREHIDEHRDAWTKITTSGEFADRFSLGGESLKRPPRGFDKADPLILDLKRKDFIATAPLTQKQICRGAFLDEFADMCGSGAGFMDFLCTAVGVDF